MRIYLDQNDIETLLSQDIFFCMHCGDRIQSNRILSQYVPCSCGLDYEFNED